MFKIFKKKDLINFEFNYNHYLILKSKKSQIKIRIKIIENLNLDKIYFKWNIK